MERIFHDHPIALYKTDANTTVKHIGITSKWKTFKNLFNLNKEREEGYFIVDGNFVEYRNDNEIKDVWLDNVEVDTKYIGKTSATTNNEDNNEVGTQDLSFQDIGIMKRRIVDVLKPGETVILHDDSYSV
ncbi:hypothetical protein SCA6_019271 [Theobroma cacao]